MHVSRDRDPTFIPAAANPNRQFMNNESIMNNEYIMYTFIIHNLFICTNLCFFFFFVCVPVPVRVAGIFRLSVFFRFSSVVFFYVFSPFFCYASFFGRHDSNRCCDCASCYSLSVRLWRSVWISGRLSCGFTDARRTDHRRPYAHSPHSPPLCQATPDRFLFSTKSPGGSIFKKNESPGVCFHLKNSPTTKVTVVQSTNDHQNVYFRQLNTVLLIFQR